MKSHIINEDKLKSKISNVKVELNKSSDFLLANQNTNTKSNNNYFSLFANLALRPNKKNKGLAIKKSKRRKEYLDKMLVEENELDYLNKSEVGFEKEKRNRKDGNKKYTKSQGDKRRRG